MKGIQLRQVRDILDEMHLSSRYDENGNLEIIFSASEDFVYDVVIIISAIDNRLSYLAFAPGYTPDKYDMYRLANSHNSRCYMPICVVRNNIPDFEYSFLLDEDVSPDYVRENCVLMPIRSILRSFRELEEKYEQ